MDPKSKTPAFKCVLVTVTRDVSSNSPIISSEQLVGASTTPTRREYNAC
jgi:hypothetical protein